MAEDQRTVGVKVVGLAEVRQAAYDLVAALEKVKVTVNGVDEKTNEEESK